MRIQPKVLPRRLFVARRGGNGRRWTPPQFVPEPARIPTAIRDLLAEPTWSVRSLLPPGPQDSQPPANTATAQPAHDHDKQQEITRDKLHHLLRLSALPLPKGPEEEKKLLDSLHRHLHFVRAVQSVNTTKPVTWEDPRVNPNDPVIQAVWKQDPKSEVEPLVTIRDESFEGIGEATIHLRDLWPSLQKEEKRGINKAVRRKWKVSTDWDKELFQRFLEKHSTAATAEKLDEDQKANMKAEADRLAEAHEERKDWWIDLNRTGNNMESRRKGRYFFVRRSTQGSTPVIDIEHAVHTSTPDSQQPEPDPPTKQS